MSWRDGATRVGEKTPVAERGENSWRSGATPTNQTSYDNRVAEEARRRAVQSDADNLNNRMMGWAAQIQLSDYAPQWLRNVATVVGVTEVIRHRARTGEAERDAAQNDGFLDRAGSMLERDTAGIIGGLERSVSAITPGRGGDMMATRASQMERSAGMQVSGETAWDQVKENPWSNILPYVVDTAIGSAPDMALAMMPGIGLPVLSTSMSGRIAQDRAENNGQLNAGVGDLAIAAPFGVGSAFLDRLGVSRIFGPTAGTVAGRIAQATVAEAGTEAIQSSLEYTGGTLGTARGYNAAEMIDQAAAGAVGGGGMGAGMRGTAEVFDGVTSRLPGARAPVSQSDVDSPISTDTIAEGRAIVNEALGQGAQNIAAGGRVEVTMPNGAARRGTVDAMVNLDGETGVRIKFDDGSAIEQPFSMLEDAGVDLRPLSMEEQANEIDANIANAAQALLPSQTSVLPSPGTVTTTMPAPRPAGHIVARPTQQLTQPQPAARPQRRGGAITLDENAITAYMDVTRRAESSGDDSAKNTRSSASGRYQFIEGTFKAYYRRVFGASGAQAQAAWNNRSVRFNGDVQERLMREFTRDNARILARAGLPINNGTLYLAHFAGPDTARRLLTADPNAPSNSIFGGDAMEANPVLRGKTVGQVIAWANRAIGARGSNQAQPGAASADGAGTPMDSSYSPAEPIKFEDIQWSTVNVDRAPIPARAEETFDVALTPSGREVPVQYAVAELSDLIASNDLNGDVNPAYPAERQPRQRDRAASRAQVADIAANLQPRLLGRTAKASDGAPIISPDGVVESGNGRTIALGQVYQENGEKAQEYRAFLEGEGFNVEGMEQPVLVRIRDGDMTDEDVRSFVVEANTRDNAAMSGMEEAHADALDMPGQLLDLYRGGDVDAAGNRDFVRGFMQAMVPVNDQGRMVMSDGSIAKPLVARIEAALLVRAFGNMPFVEKLVDATDNNIRAIGKALTETAPLFAKLAEAVQDGRADPSMDISRHVAEAVEIVDRARREKRPVAELVAQRDIFSGEAVEPLTEAVLRLMFARPDYTRPVGQARLSEALRYFVEEAAKTAPGGGLFGESTKATPDAILANAHAKQQANTLGEQPDLIRPAAAEPDWRANATAVEQSGNGDNGQSVPATGVDNDGSSGTGVQARPSTEGASESVAAEPTAEPVSQPDTAPATEAQTEAEPVTPETKDTAQSLTGDANAVQDSTPANDELGNTQPSPEAAPDKPAVSPNRLVTDDRAAELRKRLKEKLNPNRVNAGIDPEIIAIGAELTVYHIEKGARRFQALATAIAGDLDMKVKDLRQYLRSWYNGVRDMMVDMGESVDDMDVADEVAKSMRSIDQWADVESEAPAPVTTETESASESPSDVAPTVPEMSNVDQDTEPSETGGDMRGEDIDGDWAAFAEDSGSLNIPRAEMPQIKAEHRGAMVNFLNARGIDHSERTADPQSFKPTQAEFSPAKVDQAKSYEGGNRAILVSSDNHIVDGHHQWLAARDEGNEIRVIELQAPITELLQVVSEFPSAETADGSTEAVQSDAEAASEDVAPSDATTGGQRIEDFGEKLEGARKDYAESYRDRLSDAENVDMAAQPLSKAWPEPDYDKLLNDGVDPYVVAWSRAARDEVPPKPRRPHAVRSWVEDVSAMRKTVNGLLNGEVSADSLKDKMADTRWSRRLNGVVGRAELYQAVGHGRSLKGVTLRHHHYTLYRGRENVQLWAVEQQAKATSFSNWPRELMTGDTKQEALDKFKAIAESGGLDRKKNDVVRFDIYSRTGQKGFFIGKKVGKDYVDLERFDTAKEARDFKVNNYDDLVSALDKFKDIPPERKEVNSPRIGINHRNGVDVTPEMFSEAFGFRGVQFGNYVEGARRQADLNEAYDALMDLAGVIGVPAKALSLDGQLGLAFGARGKGGKNAASAHFEPGNIVINLTKKSGAGSLAHEWWHSLDNYFSRLRSLDGYMTDALDAKSDGVRPEMVEAFRSVMSAIRQTAIKERSGKLDKRRTKSYWATDIEMSARAFESYVIAKLADEQFSNDYLANVVSEEVFGLESAYPYPTAAEIDTVRAGFDEFFRVIETKETASGVALQSRIDPDETPVVAELIGNELGVDVSDLPALRNAALAHYRKNLLGRTMTMADGAKVSFTNRGMRESTFGKGDILLRIVPAIGEIVSKGQIVDRVPGDRANIKEVVTVAGVVVLDGERRSVAVTVREHSDSNLRQYALSWDLRVRGQSSRIEGAQAQVFGGPDIEVTPDLNVNITLLDEGSNNAAKASNDTDEASNANVFDADALQERLTALGLSDKVALRVVDTLNGAAGDYGADGAALIRIARDTKQGAQFTLDHEAIHALRSLGAVSKTDWNILASKAKSNAAIMASVNRRYPDLSAEARVEEAVADMFAGHVRNKKQKGMIGRLLDRVGSIVEAIRNAWRGDGLRSASGVMADIDSGKTAFLEPVKMPNANSEKSDGSNFRNSSSEKESNSSEAIWSDTDPDIVTRNESRVSSDIDLTEHASSDIKGKLGQALDRWRVRMQDRYLPVLRVQQRVESALGRALPTTANPYMREELMTGRIGSRLEKLSNDMVDPLFAAMHKAGVTVDEVETYLYARHAPERNAQIAKINPELPDGGSGMSDIEAAALMNRMKKSEKFADIEAIAAMVDDINAFALKTRQDAGLLSADEVKAWTETYEHYVPLRGQEEVNGDATGLTERINRSGGGLNVQGKESRRAYGRRSKADNVLAYTLLQAEEAIVRAETNLVATAFVNMARRAPDKDFWQVDKVTRKPVINSTTGLVRYEEQTRLQPEDRDYTVSAKINGAEVRVTMNKQNPSARQLADSMRNLTQQQLDWVVKYLGMPSRFLSAVNTSWNPEFIVTNAFRDIQSAAINLAGLEKEKLTRGTMRDYRKALIASTRGAFGKGKGEWGRWYQEMTEAGGRVYFNQVDSLDDMKRRVEQGVERASGKLTVKRTLFAVRDFVEAANSGVENAVRLAAYKNARELGMSQAEAASIAKNVTVNFNRRGTFGPMMNAAYMFFNASVQGSTRILIAMKSPRVRKMLAGIAVGSFFLELLNAMLSDDDDDGQSFYDKISDTDKNRNLIIMIPGGRGEHIRIPMPYGYNVFASLGRTTAEIMRRGGKDAAKSGASFVTAVVDAFNPVGGTDSLLNFVAPTLLDPIVDLERNKDFTGRNIMPEQNQFGPETPDAQRYFGPVNPMWKAVTDFLTSATGGDDVVAGKIDVSPETLEYLSGTVLGAAGGFVERQFNLDAKLLDDESTVEARDLPFVRRVFSSKPSWFDQSAYYDRSAQVEQAVSNAKQYIENGDAQRFESYVRSNERLLMMEADMKAARSDMRRIRASRGELELLLRQGQIDDATYRANRRHLNDLQTTVTQRFNGRWNEVMNADDGQ